MTASAAGFVIVPAAQATHAQLRDRRRAVLVSRHIGAECRKLGYVRRARALFAFYARAWEACLKSRLQGGDGRLPSAETDGMMVKLDGHRRNRHPRRRQEAVALLHDMGLMDYGRGWVEALPMGPRPVVLRAPRRAKDLENLRSKPRLKSKIPVPPSFATVYAIPAGAAPGAAAPPPKKNLNPICGPKGDGPRNAAPRDPGGRYAPRPRKGSCAEAAPEERRSELDAAESPSRSRLRPAPKPIELTSFTPAVVSSRNQEAQAPVSATSLESSMPTAQTPAISHTAVRDTDLAEAIAQAHRAFLARSAEWKAKGIPEPEPYRPAAQRPQGTRLAPNGLPMPERAQAPRNVSMADDGAPTDFTWLQLSLGGVAALKGLQWTWAAKQGFTRGQWRAAVGALVAVAPGRVDDPIKYVLGVLRQLANGESKDSRRGLGYFPFATWGAAALKFANVAI